METLYTALQDEIQLFKEHIRSCQEAFDIDTLYNVLLLLSGNGSVGAIQSLEQLERLVESHEWDEQDSVRITAGRKNYDIPSYVSWFVSYVRYLGSLKEAFDTKVVFPLCENLYVNDASPGSWPFRCNEGCSSNATSSVANTAKQLFSVRRRWALLLKGGTIDEQVFSPQSWLSVQGFAIHPFVKIMRLVPDLFHKSLATAELARQWVELHASRHGPCLMCSDPGSTTRCNDAVDSVEHFWGNVSLSRPGLPKTQPDWTGVLPQFQASSNSRDTSVRNISQERNKLYEAHGELMSLLWREERSWVLEAEIREVNQRISNLQLQQEDKERELEGLKHQLERDGWSVPDMQHQKALCELDAFRRQLRLEEYRKSILQGDWLLELEVRPALLRPLNTLQERCQELARLFQGMEVVSQVLPLANGIDLHSSCCSGGLNRLCSGPQEHVES